MKIEPRKESDRGGWVGLPLFTQGAGGKKGGGKGGLPGWGGHCWEKPEEAGGVFHRNIDGAAC
mgnify:CR=1 FL=1